MTTATLELEHKGADTGSALCECETHPTHASGLKGVLCATPPDGFTGRLKQCLDATYCSLCRRFGSSEEARVALLKWRATDRVMRHLMSKVDKQGDDECWEWKGPKIHTGYGQLRAFDRQRWSAHRLSWHLHNGPIPDGLWVLHRCDNPPCCNPKHLFLGTYNENVADKVQKKRQAQGEMTNINKLTAQQVVEVIGLRKLKVSLSKIAVKFSVTASTISAISRGHTWKFLPR